MSRYLLESIAKCIEYTVYCNTFEISIGIAIANTFEAKYWYILNTAILRGSIVNNPVSLCKIFSKPICRPKIMILR